MGEPTCALHPFSYTTPASFANHINEENGTMYGIENSVSFGRFMSDNLEWERWSTFSNNRNRYVEEAEKYSKPGSVAQKKAYFEAHFKKIAALKAAALLEQGNVSELSDAGKMEFEGMESTTQGVPNLSIIVQVDENTNNEVDSADTNNEDVPGYVAHKNDVESADTNNEVNTKLCKSVDPKEPSESSCQNKIYPVAVKDENCSESKESQSCGVGQMEKPLLQKRSRNFIKEDSESIVKKNPPLSSYMSPSVGGTARASLLSDSTTKYAGSLYPGREVYTTPTKKKNSVTDPDKKRTPLRMSINREINRIISPVLRKIGTSKSSKDCSTPLKTPAKTTNAALESSQMTPSRRALSRLDSNAGYNKVLGSRWHIFSSDASMSPSVARSRISSPVIPNSFCMSGERAARRKQKLEDKFNATATEKPPQSSKFKEKAGAELKKFRQSFCLKATLSPDHYGENDALTSPKREDESTQGKSPKRGKRPAKTTSKIILPPRRPPMKQ